jgi:hypothetical protein
MVIMDKIYTVAFNQGTPRNKVQYITQLQNTHIDYIFLGSSRVENHIDCAVVEKLTGKSCINLGLQGSKTNDSAAFLQMLQNNEVTYDKVLFQLDYAVNFDAYSPQFKSYITPYLNNETVSENIKEDLNQPWGYKIPYIRYAANDKLIGFREVLLQLTHKKPNVDLNNGYVLLTGNSVAVNGSLPQNIQKENDGVQLLQQLEPNHLIFYTSPYCNNVPNREAFMKELTSNYPQVFNYIGLFDNQKGKFSDCGHLNLNGSQLFTAQITQDILLNSH